MSEAEEHNKDTIRRGISALQPVVHDSERFRVDLNLSSAENSFAREAFLHRFDGTAIDTVFAPGEYNIPQ